MPRSFQSAVPVHCHQRPPAALCTSTLLAMPMAATLLVLASAAVTTPFSVSWPLAAIL
jgi:hypothetical protein